MEGDGPLPDGIAMGTTLVSWQLALDALLAAGWPITFERDNEESPLPAAADLFDSGTFNIVCVRPHPDVLVIIRRDCRALR